MFAGDRSAGLLDRKVELQLSAPAAAAVGAGLAVVMSAPLLLLSNEAGVQFLAVQLGYIGAVYLGFAVADGTVRSLLVEFPVSGAFMAIAAAALWAGSPAVLAVGYCLHGLWDFAHHPRAVPTPVRSWYPPFCVVFDVLVAAFIVVWLPLGGVA